MRLWGAQDVHLTAESISMGLSYVLGERSGTDGSAFGGEEDKDMHGLNCRRVEIAELTGQWTMKSLGGEMMRGSNNLKMQPWLQESGKPRG